MYFRDRRDAGKRLGEALKAKYKNQDVVVYALPRGGVVVAEEIAKALEAPLTLIFAHKIGHPYQPEYAVGAVSESGHVIVTPHELASVGEEWIESEKGRQMEEIKRRGRDYLKDVPEISTKGKIAIIVDDGVATGLTLKVGILELKGKHPKKIVATVPVAPRTTAEAIEASVDDFVALDIPEDYEFLGAVGAYYDNFYQVEDEEVIDILNTHAQDIAKAKRK